MPRVTVRSLPVSPPPRPLDWILPAHLRALARLVLLSHFNRSFRSTTSRTRWPSSPGTSQPLSARPRVAYLFYGAPAPRRAATQLRRGHAVPLDDERLLPHGCHRVRHRQADARARRGQYSRRPDARWTRSSSGAARTHRTRPTSCNSAADYKSLGWASIAGQLDRPVQGDRPDRRGPGRGPAGVAGTGGLPAGCHPAADQPAGGGAPKRISEKV